jgi:2-polyprenyl-3-methyl-5-hydroxy-6-metoxy-1,4-benzoquinol methylase
MHKIRVKIPLYIPDFVYQTFQSINSRYGQKKFQRDLQGDRDIEWSFVAAHMPQGPGYALDFGTGGSSLGLIAARRKFHVTSVDLGKINWPYVCSRLQFIQGDVSDLTFPPKKFDLIINCSTIEHVGLAGRYNITRSNPEGDIEAMRYLKKLMKPDGQMLITIPVGRDAAFLPLHRVYGTERLRKLFSGFTIEHEEFWVKNDENQWALTNRAEALMEETQSDLYGLGCFTLRTPD